MLKLFPNLKVYGGDDRIEGLSSKVGHGDKFKVGDFQVESLFTPCHTAGHICYYVKSGQEPPAVFTGESMKYLNIL